MIVNRRPNEAALWLELAIHIAVLLAVFFQMALALQAVQQLGAGEVYTLPPVLVRPAA
ncbi:hypothetical protein [Gloeobacter morelensis]|uniref:Uncharacterized protein n=1 Tax=Gloeobacter morelensis MG652769 TaxID=2781736 RepID=A0ABY3PGC3_9CYAN|nr:hypothetical protein [Gloeobacter morelensis]UFP92583.1 hypothetical protein ISF26_12075 [Gloeobacter morelensis MG652769]